MRVEELQLLEQAPHMYFLLHRLSTDFSKSSKDPSIAFDSLEGELKI